MSASAQQSNTFTEGVSPDLWLRLASYGWRITMPCSQREAERIRRSRVAAYVGAGILLALVILFPILTIGDPGTNTAWGIALGGAVAALLCNRHGWSYTAGVLLIASLLGAVAVAFLLSDTDLSLDMLPTFDMLVVPVAIAPAILVPWSGVLVACAATGEVLFLYYAVPHNPDIAHDLATTFPSSPTVGVVAYIARPAAIFLAVSVIAWIWAHSTWQSERRLRAAQQLEADQRAISAHQLQFSTFFQYLTTLNRLFRASVERAIQARLPGGYADSHWVRLDLPEPPPSLAPQLAQAAVAERGRLRSDSELVNFALRRLEGGDQQSAMEEQRLFAMLSVFAHRFYAIVDTGRVIFDLDPVGPYGPTGIAELDVIAALITAVVSGDAAAVMRAQARYHEFAAHHAYLSPSSPAASRAGAPYGGSGGGFS